MALSKTTKRFIFAAALAVEAIGGHVGYQYIAADARVRGYERATEDFTTIGCGQHAPLTKHQIQNCDALIAKLSIKLNGEEARAREEMRPVTFLLAELGLR